MIVSSSAQIFTILTCTVILFQACLVAGLPWGKASMGGKFPGKYPPKMRLVAIINIIVLGFISIIVLSKANLLFPELNSFSKTAIWFVIVFYLVGTIMNTITPSRIERIWAPVALLQLIASIIVAVG
jgi:predicted membrane channel-forming protein YqfA (hemolysin III family)